jgi:metal-dependent amidase/aminoacylase/carboxypeptidase family protein
LWTLQYPSLFELYTNLHAHPELSLQEQKSSARLAENSNARVIGP